MNLDGKVALVTGGARRLGKAVALELADAGCHVQIHYHLSETEARETRKLIEEKGVRADVCQADLTDPTTWHRVIEDTVKTLGNLDILINNAAAFSPETKEGIDSFDLTHWEQMLRMNLLAPLGLCHQAAERLRQNEGRIVNLLDIMMDSPPPGLMAYATSKAALGAATRSLARDLAPQVRVYGVAPGIAQFPEEASTYDEATRAALVDRIPLGREGTPETVAEVVRCLLQAGDYVTGEIVRVDGGRHLH